MMIDRLEGNSELKTSVRLMLGGRRMTHSVLLVGEEGLGTGFAARCVAADAHVALDLLPNALKGRPAKYLKTLIYILCLVFFVALTYAGFSLCELGMRQKSATMRIPMNYVYSCIPICGILSIYFLVLKVFRLYSRKEEKEA